ncbi:MAG TPA: biotin--[acetyl-CoA-carboxylase] ligase [Bacteroidales bacterium]|nr:biotin--[acetyl-CoA-carboxylase] ligase [Bacteroidales bacterium]
MIIGSNIIFHKILTSTNSTAIALASSRQAEEGTVIRAGYQLAGKGQPGNSWESEEGKNLLFSIILQPSELDPAEQFYVSMVVSTAIHDFVSGFVSSCTIKWPNDIFVSGDKIAGILIESSITGSTIDYMVAGIGFNVNQEIFKSGKNPVSLKLLTGENYDTDKLFTVLLQCLDRRYLLIREKRFAEIRSEYLKRLYKLNEWTTFSEKGKEFTGRILTVENDGAIIIEKKSGIKSRFYFKEVEFWLTSGR